MVYHETKLLPNPSDEEKVMCSWMYNWKGIFTLYKSLYFIEKNRCMKYSGFFFEESRTTSENEPWPWDNREAFYSFLK